MQIEVVAVNFKNLQINKRRNSFTETLNCVSFSYTCVAYQHRYSSAGSTQHFIPQEGVVGAYQKPQNRAKNRRKPQNRNKFRPKPKSEIKPLTDKTSVGFRISLLFNFSTSKLVLLARIYSAHSLHFLVPCQCRTHCSLKNSFWLNFRTPRH